MERWKKCLMGLMAIVVAATAVIATQYATVQVTAKVTIDHQYSAIQFMAGDGSPAGTGKVLQWDDTNKIYVLEFGAWMPGATKLFTATFAIVNTEAAKLEITGISVSGDAILGEIWLHQHMSKLSNTNISGVPAEEDHNNYVNRCEANDNTVQYYDGSAAQHVVGWVLAAGHGYPSNALEYTNDGTSWTQAPYDGTAKIWSYNSALTDATGLTCSGTTTAANFVWVEIQLHIPTGSEPGAQSAAITFYFKSVE